MIYKDVYAMWQRRRKGSDYKAINAWAGLRKDGEDLVVFDRDNYASYICIRPDDTAEWLVAFRGHANVTLANLWRRFVNFGDVWSPTDARKYDVTQRFRNYGHIGEKFDAPFTTGLRVNLKTRVIVHSPPDHVRRVVRSKIQHAYPLVQQVTKTIAVLARMNKLPPATEVFAHGAYTQHSATLRSLHAATEDDLPKIIDAAIGQAAFSVYRSKYDYEEMFRHAQDPAYIEYFRHRRQKFLRATRNVLIKALHNSPGATELRPASVSK